MTSAIICNAEASLPVKVMNPHSFKEDGVPQSWSMFRSMSIDSLMLESSMAVYIAVDIYFILRSCTLSYIYNNHRVRENFNTYDLDKKESLFLMQKGHFCNNGGVV